MVSRKKMKSTNDLDKRLRDVIYFPQTDTFLITFLDGRAYHLPRAALAVDLEFDHTSLITAVTIGTDLDYYFTIHFASGATFEVPWDRVLHECEPTYAYFKGRRLKEDRAARAYEAQQVRRLRQQAGLTQEALAKRAGTSTAKPGPGRIRAVSAVTGAPGAHRQCTGPTGERPRRTSRTFREHLASLTRRGRALARKAARWSTGCT